MAYSKRFFLLFLSLLISVQAVAATPKPLPTLPIWDAEDVASGDSLIFVNTTQSNLAHRLYLYDLVNLPPFASSSYILGKPLTGFVASSGTVTAADTLKVALEKLAGNSTPSAPVSVGAFDGQTPDAKGLALVSNILYAQSADATRPGMVNTVGQTFAGAKTFSGGVIGNVTGVASGNELPLSFTSPLLRSTNTISCQVASGSLSGCLSSGDWTTFNNKGNVVGPASATADALALFDGTTGKLLKDSPFTSDPSNGTLNVAELQGAGGTGNDLLLSSNSNYDSNVLVDNVARFDTVGQSVNVGSSAGANTGAILDVAGTHGGFGLPNLTTVQRDALTPARSGVTIYNTSNSRVEVWTGATWTADISGNAATASAFDHTPAECDPGEFQIGMEADGDAICEVVDGLPDQTGNNGKYLTTNGSAASWADVVGTNVTTKGDLQTYSTTGARLPVAANGYLLTPNSAQTTGLEWVATLPTAAVPAFTGGDVTSAGASLSLSIPNDTVTNAKSANMAQSTIKGRAVSAGTGDPTDLSATQATAILDVMVGDSGSGGTKGLVPAPAAGDAAAGKFLAADGTYQPAGTQIISDWQSYTPTFTGFGTAHTFNMFWRRVGDSVQIKGSFASGSVTGVEARVSLPSGLTSAAGIAPIEVVGELAYSSAALQPVFVLAEPGVGYVTFGIQSASLAGLTKQTGTNISSLNVTNSFTAIVPVSGWSSGGGTSPILALSDWQSYTPASTQGFGTVTSPEFFYRRVGDSVEIAARFTTGTMAASEARISLPTGLTTDSSKITGRRIAGTYQQDETNSNHGGSVLVESGVTYVTFGFKSFGSGNVNPLSKADGNVIAPSTTVFAFSTHPIPVAGWTSTSSGTPTAPRCEIRVDTANGHGSTNTKFRRWTTTRRSSGSCVTYADSATLGGSFVILQAGMYCASYADYYASGAEWVGVSRYISGATPQGTTNFSSSTVANHFAAGTPTAGLSMTSTACGLLNVGDTLYGHTNGNANAASAHDSFFILSKVSN